MHSSDLVLSWPAPAATWTEAAPVGNGRIGAMVFGGTDRTRIQINDSTVWSGTPDGPATALAELRAQGAGPERLEEVRTALRAGDQDRAESLLMTFEGPYTQEYLPYADLHLTVPGGERAEYRGRTLDLDTAVAEDGFDLDGTTVRRRVWADAVTGALCVTLDADGGTVDLAVELSTPLRELLRSVAPEGITLGIEIPVDGAPAHEPEVAEPLRYADGPVDGYDPFGALALAVGTDGTTTVDDEGGLRVTGASHVLLTLASSTAAHRDWCGAPAVDRVDHLAEAGELAARAVAQGADRLLKDHEADVRALLGGTSLRVGPRRSGTYDAARDILGGGDELLTATVLFQLGRHLLATASRPGTGPRPTSRASGTPSCVPPGRPTTRSTSTPR
ncbi:glycoside hydrolase N-terminal domain-containing protein [Streptomyces galilaeus]